MLSYLLLAWLLAVRCIASQLSHSLTVGLQIKVLLVGLDGFGDTKLKVDPSTLVQCLEQVLPSYDIPIVGPDGTHSVLSASTSITYEVLDGGQALLRAYGDALLASASAKLNKEERTVHLEVPIESVTQAMEKHPQVAPPTQIYPVFGSQSVTILVVNPSKPALLRTLQAQSANKINKNSSKITSQTGAGLEVIDFENVLKLEYRFSAPRTDVVKTNGDTVCAQAWVGKGRVLFLDLAALPCRYGSLFGLNADPHSPGASNDEMSTPQTVGGIIEEGTLPTAVHTRLLPRALYSDHEPKPGGLAEMSGSEMSLKITSVIVSAVRTVLVPQVPWNSGSSSSTANAAGVNKGDTRTHENNTSEGGEVVVIVVATFGAGYTKSEVYSVEDEDQPGVVDYDSVVNSLRYVSLPHQNFVILGGDHDVSEHPQVLVALQKSVRHASVPHQPILHGNNIPSHDKDTAGGAHTYTYVDGDRVLLEIAETGDLLTSTLLKDGGIADWSVLLQPELASSLSPGTHVGKGGRLLAKLGGMRGNTNGAGGGLRVLPVFVFCVDELFDEKHRWKAHPYKSSDKKNGDDINETSYPYLFGDSFPLWASPFGSAVLGLQSDNLQGVRVPFQENSEPVSLSLASVTRSVLAGALETLYGIVPPYQWYSTTHGGAVSDLTWAYGYHPFAPFGFDSELPGQLIADTVGRNVVISHLASAAQGLHTAVSKLKMFVHEIIPPSPTHFHKKHAESKEPLNVDGDPMSISEETWGNAFETAAKSSGIPQSVITSILDAHVNVLHVAGLLDKDCTSLRGKALAKASLAAEAVERSAIELLNQVEDTIKEGRIAMQCCTLGVSSKPSYTQHSAGLTALIYGIGALVSVTGVWGLHVGIASYVSAQPVARSTHLQNR